MVDDLIFFLATFFLEAGLISTGIGLISAGTGLASTWIFRLLAVGGLPRLLGFSSGILWILSMKTSSGIELNLLAFGPFSWFGFFPVVAGLRPFFFFWMGCFLLETGCFLFVTGCFLFVTGCFFGSGGDSLFLIGVASFWMEILRRDDDVLCKCCKIVMHPF